MPKNLWKILDYEKYEDYVTFPSIDEQEIDERVVYMDDLEKRKQAYGICGECNEPGTGEFWCQPCDAKRFRENFKNWTSENEAIDEFIQQSQLSAIHHTKCLEWIPFENFKKVTYISKGSHGKLYSAEWSNGCINSWDIENQEWKRCDMEVALKNFDNSFDTPDIITDFLNEINLRLQIHTLDVIRCFGLTQDPDTKDYIMVLEYCDGGSLRNYINKSKNFTDYESKIFKLFQITRGLLDIHNAEKVHKDFHSDNILITKDEFLYINNLRMCQPENEEQPIKIGKICGVIPYMAPEVLCGCQYTKAADIYSFGIVMNEFLSEEVPFNDISHNRILAIKICNGLRPKISEDIPKLFVDLINKCWDAKAENRPTAKELYQIFIKLNYDKYFSNSEIYFQIEESDKIMKNEIKSSSKKNNSKNTHVLSNSIYTNKFLYSENSPESLSLRFICRCCKSDGHQDRVIISTIDLTTEIDDKIVYMEDLEKRKQLYGICKECNEPGTGFYWCRPCNAKRFKDNFKNWTSGNKDIDEFIQQSQLNGVYYLEWIPFEKFQNITYIAEGDFGKIYSAEWPEGFINYWNIENQKWYRFKSFDKYALKSLNNSSDISYFLNEIKSHLQFYTFNIVRCYGITQYPNTKEYMMVLMYCKGGNLRCYLNESKGYINYASKIDMLQAIAEGLLGIHNAGKVHKDLHSGNILLYNGSNPLISDLGLCELEQPDKVEKIYGVLPYVAPEVLHGRQYTKAADIYSFGIIMNEFLSEEIPFNDIPHDYILAVKICKGLRPVIYKGMPKLLADLIMKCWDAKTKNRPTAKELYYILKKLNNEKYFSESEIYLQIEECDKISEGKFKNNSRKDIFSEHPYAIYTTRLLKFENLSEPVNSSDLPSQFS
ncbi:kinase-like domain-containing protein [Rhizophagus irregularis DAOM 181602=DAOM 197198]|uniref:Cdc15p n=2 Tax=Rhizophagus irregularis TaxID=588596 RepID=A0A015JYY3_RHIIW|nr:kinase-like domain-containing protein [Rhizophagus irregularis DAOM 181602=DAOM 197198]EXX60289.1 Cdc15p [Rhizophagus irregularis DAOM 197198w]POG82361.1 kinase-like domain-containing protein [Rhizophagus irregularis DAOM 181602=DAOM 197198]|eukprot:XP_025189227.1 kinase-like domain-containing protein [Rhizophagus irregularis DAOM 181602=DAOM 197198]